MPPPPSSPLHPGPGFLDPSSDTPCQPHLPFQFPLHRLHWSRHSLSPPCPFRPSSILQTSVGPGLLMPSAFYTPPALYYLTHKTPPTLTHWWFSTWGAQPRHPTDGSLPLTHHPINLHRLIYVGAQWGRTTLAGSGRWDWLMGTCQMTK